MDEFKFASLNPTKTLPTIPELRDRELCGDALHGVS
jgi:hypothetical protein